MRNRISNGLVWNATNVLVNKGMSLVVKLILTRLLLPEQFGLVSMVVVATGLLTIFADLGFQKALIQRKRDKRSLLRYDSAFWLLAAAGGLMVAFMWLAGIPFLVWFYNEPLLVPIALALSFSIWFRALSTIPRVRLHRAMHFRTLVQAEMIGVVAASIVAIILGLLGAGVWSLVAQTLLSSAVTATLLWRYTSWRPRFRFSLGTLYDIKGFSVYTLATTILFFTRSHLDIIFVGKLLGASSLGAYTLAFILTETLRMKIYQIVNRVLFPVFSRLQDDPLAIKPYYVGVIRYTTLVTFPISMLLILYAEVMIPDIFSDNWIEAVLPVQILAIASMIFSMSGAPAEVLKGLGKPQIAFRISVLNTLFIAFPVMWVGTLWFGLQGAAWAVVIHYTTSRLAHHAAMRREISITEKDILKSAFPAIIGVLAMLVPWWLSQEVTYWVWTVISSIIIYMTVAAATYFLQKGGEMWLAKNKNNAVIKNANS